MNKIKVIGINKINWYQEELDKFYGDNNNGYVFGIDTGEDIVWYKTEKERDDEYKSWLWIKECFRFSR